MSDLAILSEDDDLLAVDKPAGVLSFPPTGRSERNLTDIARAHASRRGASCFAVHRLDRDTSGVLVFAKTEAAKAALDRAFRDGGVKKTYLAIVNGVPRPPLGRVKTYIADKGDRAISSRTPLRDGKTAITNYRTLERFANAALIEARPETGRFNQIRLHCVDIGCPIVGERKYAVASRLPMRGKRMMLHASRLEFKHPRDGRALVIEAPLPADFEALLDSLR